MVRRVVHAAVLALLLGAGYFIWTQPENLPFAAPWKTATAPQEQGAAPQPPASAVPSGPLGELTDAALQAFVARQPISIQALRAGEYPGSALQVVRTLGAGSNYSRQVVAYQSEGLKIFALLTVPNGTPPPGAGRRSCSTTATSRRTCTGPPSGTWRTRTPLRGRAS